MPVQKKISHRKILFEELFSLAQLLCCLVQHGFTGNGKMRYEIGRRKKAQQAPLGKEIDCDQCDPKGSLHQQHLLHVCAQRKLRGQLVEYVTYKHVHNNSSLWRTCMQWEKIRAAVPM